MKSLLFGLALFGALSASLWAQPKIGEPQPAWHFTDLQGNVVTSESLKGKVVVLDFWATWCGPCKKEIPSLIKLQKQYGEQGLAIVGVAMEGDAGPVRKYARNSGINYPVGISNDQIYAAFGQPDTIPSNYLIDRTGVIRDAKVGAINPATYEKKIVTLLQSGANPASN
jgi:thiol-disulfide isomerase/thioredoxin